MLARSTSARVPDAPDQRAENTPGEPPSTSTARPESSATAGSPLCAAASRALSSAFSAKVTPVSATSGLASSRPTTGVEVEPGADRASARISPQLGDLVLVAGGEHQPGRHRGYPAGAAARASACSRVSSAQPATARSSSASSSRAVERRALGGALHLDEPAVAGGDDVHVGVGADVLLVAEVEDRRAVDDADAHGRDRVDQRVALDDALAVAHEMASAIAT